MDIMIDLETLSSQPDAAIVSIGACTFFHGDATRKTFSCVIDPRSSQRAGGHVDAGTVIWWMAQSAEARDVFGNGDALPLREALLRFSLFVGQWPERRIWGNGAGFDNVVLRRSYERCGDMTAPWNFRDDRCYRTLKSLRPDIAPVRQGVAHNALDDAIAQAVHAEAILETMRV